MSQQKIKTMACCLGINMLLYGCAASNVYEGLGDYRFASSQAKDKMISNFDHKYFANIQTGELFNKEDYIAINLKTAYFNYITEPWLERKYNEQVGTNVTGEIAVVANISSSTQSPYIRKANGELPGRVIFYSGDFQEGQFANQSFGPVYGPIKWDGNGLTLDLTVVELDNEENEQFNAVLSTLSKAGKSSLAMYSPAIDLMNSIGQALVTANKDDIMGAYTLHLLSRPTSDNTFTPTLRTGDIIIVRKSNRNSIINWEELAYDHSTGMLLKCNYDNIDKELADKMNKLYPYDGCKSTNKENTYPFASLLREHNYIVFSITKRNGGVDLTPTLTFANLLEKIEDKTSPGDVSSAITNFSESFNKEIAFNNLRDDLDIINTSKDASLKKLATNRVIQSVQCSIRNIKKDDDKDVYKSWFKVESEADINAYCKEVLATETSQLKRSQVEYLILELSKKCNIDFGWNNIIGKDATRETLTANKDKITKLMQDQCKE